MTEEIDHVKRVNDYFTKLRNDLKRAITVEEKIEILARHLGLKDSVSME